MSCLGLQLPGYCGGLRLPDLHLWRLRHRVPKDPQGPQGAQATPRHQQGSG